MLYEVNETDCIKGVGGIGLYQVVSFFVVGFHFIVGAFVLWNMSFF